MLENRKYFDENEFRCDARIEEQLTCCAVCKVADQISNMPANFKSLYSQCCATVAQPIIKSIPCKIGYTFNKATSTCEDIDECQIRNNGCYESQDCVNTDGGYYCIPKATCRTGYSFYEDEMECRKDLSDDWKYNMITSTEHVWTIDDANPIIAINDTEVEESATAHSVECSSGYKFDQHAGTCVDIDECLQSPCQHYCRNHGGGYECYCRRGFKAIGNICTDINECERNPCSYECVNVVGSFRCLCPQGQVLGVDRKNCVGKLDVKVIVFLSFEDF